MHPSRIFSIYLLLFLFLAAVLTYRGLYFSFAYTLLSLSFILTVLFWKTNFFRYVGLLVICVSLLLVQVMRLTPTGTPGWWGHYQGKEITAKMVIVSEPGITGPSQSYLVEAARGTPKGRIQVSENQMPKRHYGDVLLLSGELKEYRGPVGFAKVHRISGSMSYPEIRVVGDSREVSGPRGMYLYFRSRLIGYKDHLVNICGRVLPEPEAGLLSGILFGTKAELTDVLMQMLIITGTVHIIALSGYNITIVAKGSQAVTKGLSRDMAFWVPIVGITVFVFSTGLSASVTRAAIMGGLMLLAAKLGRQSDSLNAILFASAIMVLANPYILLYDIGFQLSFAAVAGIIYFGPILERPFVRLGNIIGPVLAGTLAAQVFSWPIIAYYFGRVSVVGILANAFILPAIPLLMLLGFLVLCIGVIYLPLAQFLAVFPWVLLEYTLKVVELFARVSWASVESRTVGILFLFAYYFALIAGLLLWQKIQRSRLAKQTI